MNRTELIEMLKEVPDNVKIHLLTDGILEGVKATKDNIDLTNSHYVKCKVKNTIYHLTYSAIIGIEY